MRIVSPALLLALTIVVPACAGRRAPVATEDPVLGLTHGYDDDVRADVVRLRRATAPFHDLAAAGVAGYPTAPMPRCVADSTRGGMGHHLIGRRLVDAALSVEHPEMLIYAPTATGGLELVGVEYIVPYRYVPATATPPKLFGQDLKHWDEFNYWELHVWAWRKNPAGLFADWHPDIHC